MSFLNFIYLKKSVMAKTDVQFSALSVKLKSEKNEFLFQFQSHPNYPSALAFSDTLNFLGVKNNAYNLEKEYCND